MKLSIRRYFRYLVPYLLTNGIGFLIDLALLYYQAQILGLPYVFAVISSFVLSAAFTHAVLFRFIFTQSARTYTGSGAWYLIVSSLRMADITLLTLFFVEVMFLGLFPARIIAATLDGIVFFFVDLAFTFKEKMKE